MKMENIPFGITDWAQIEAERHPGDSGFALWRVAKFGDIRVRMVDYSPGYVADHWCIKGAYSFVPERRNDHRPGRWTHVCINAGRELSGCRRCRSSSVHHPRRGDVVYCGLMAD